jgi:serine/threonine protein kinase
VALEGSVIDGREVIRPIGAGARGEVYLARDQRTRELVALRVLREPAKVPLDRLVRLRHDGIAQIFDGRALSDGRPCLWIEFVSGKSLAETGVLPLAAALPALARVSSALAHAHAQGIPHGNLKASNVLLQHNDPQKAKVVDFGLARAVSPASDLLPFAVIAYTIISGQPVSMDKPERLSARITDFAVPKLLDNLLLACLAKDLAARPTADELTAHLEGLAERPTKKDFGGLSVQHTLQPEHELGALLADGESQQLGQILGELSAALETFDPALVTLRREIDMYAAKEGSADAELRAAEKQLRAASSSERPALDKQRTDATSRREQCRVVLRMKRSELANRVSALRAQAPEALRQLYAEFDALRGK